MSLLVSRASRRLSEPVRERTPLARAELTRPGRRFAIGGRPPDGPGLLGLMAAQTLAATAVAALALTLPVWLSALILTSAPALAAAGSVRAGVKRAEKAGTPAPERTYDSLAADR